MPDLTGFETPKIVEKLSPYSASLFEAYDGKLPYDEILK